MHTEMMFVAMMMMMMVMMVMTRMQIYMPASIEKRNKEKKAYKQRYRF
jgi:hypothetical protein